MVSEKIVPSFLKEKSAVIRDNDLYERTLPPPVSSRPKIKMLSSNGNVLLMKDRYNKLWVKQGAKAIPINDNGTQLIQRPSNALQVKEALVVAGENRLLLENTQGVETTWIMDEKWNHVEDLDQEAPTTPVNFRVEDYPSFPSSPDSDKALLVWEHSTDNKGIAAYWIYRNGVKVHDYPFQSETSWLDTNLTHDTTYTYSIRAVDLSGNQSTESSAEFTTVVYYPPAPVNFSVTQNPALPALANVDEAALAWERPAGADVASYKIYKDNNLIQTVEHTINNLLDSGLTANTTYEYSISSVSSDGHEGDLAYATYTTPLGPPEPARNLSLYGTPSTDTVSITWEHSNTWSTVELQKSSSRYKIYRDGSYLKDYVNQALNIYGDTSLPAGTNYLYTVTAMQAGYESIAVAVNGYTLETWPEYKFDVPINGWLSPKGAYSTSVTGGQLTATGSTADVWNCLYSPDALSLPIGGSIESIAASPFASSSGVSLVVETNVILMFLINGDGTWGVHKVDTSGQDHGISANRTGPNPDPLKFTSEFTCRFRRTGVSLYSVEVLLVDGWYFVAEVTEEFNITKAGVTSWGNVLTKYNTLKKTDAFAVQTPGNLVPAYNYMSTLFLDNPIRCNVSQADVWSPFANKPMRMFNMTGDPMVTGNLHTPCSSGDEFQVKVFVMSNHNDFFELRVFEYTETTTWGGVPQHMHTLIINDQAPLSPTWTEYSRNFVIVDPGTTRFAVRLDGTNDGGTEIFFDGLQIIKLN